MLTYSEIQEMVKSRYGFVPKSCWIAHLKSEHGLTRGVASNRIDPNEHKHPCPEHHRRTLTEALVDLGVIPSSQ